MHRTALRSTLVAFVAILISTSASAAPITWAFSGDVISLEGAGSVFSDLGISVGDTFSGTVTYERAPAVFSTTRTADASSPLAGETAQEIRTGFGPGLVSFSGIEFQTSAGAVGYDAGYIAEGGRLQQSNNEYFQYASEIAGVTFDTFSAFQLDFANTNRQQLFRIVDALDDTLLDLGTFPDVSGFSFPGDEVDLGELLFARYLLRDVDGSGESQQIDTRIHSLVAVTVPAPASGLLIGLALLGVSRTGSRGRLAA